MLSKKRKIKGACVHYAVRLGKLVTPGTLFLCQSILGDKAGRKWSILNAVYSRGHLHLGTFSTSFFFFLKSIILPLSWSVRSVLFPIFLSHISFWSARQLKPWSRVDSLASFLTFCVFFLYALGVFHNFSFLLNLNFFLNFVFEYSQLTTSW